MTQIREAGRPRIEETVRGAWFAILLVSFAGAAQAQNDTATYEYDALGRLIKVVYPNGQDKEFELDPAGNRIQVLLGGNDGPVNDSIPTLGIGPNLINLTNWPVGSAPSGAGDVTDWPTAATYYNETRWARITGPGESNDVTAMETGQTETDANGGGTNSTNTFTIDETKAYEFSIYFRKHDTSLQNLYFGTKKSGMVRHAYSTSVNNNPYFMSWATSTQTANLDPQKWYKVVGYILPEGHPIISNADWGGIYDVETGAKVANLQRNFRWNENRTSDLAYARFFTYYSQATQNTFTNYFYLPEVRVTDITYTPVVPSLTISHVDGTEGSNVTFNVDLSAATTVETRVNYVVDHPGGSGSASSGDYTPVSGTLTIPQGATQASVSVATTQDALFEGSESIRMTLSSPVRATIGESSELADIIDDDAPPSFSVNDVSVTEGGTLSFTVSKIGSTTSSFSVNYATANGTASAGSDYTAKSGSLTFTSSETTKNVSVQTIQDSNVEPNEIAYLNLSNPSGGSTISDGQGAGTILNDDVANGPPVANNDSYTITVSCCSTVTYNMFPLNNDTDPEQDPLTITSITQPPGSSVSATIYSPIQIRLTINTTFYNGTMTYTVSDGNGGTDTATISIEIDEPEQGGGE